MQTEHYTETSENVYQTAWCHMPQDNSLHSLYCEIFTSQLVQYVQHYSFHNHHIYILQAAMEDTTKCAKSSVLMEDAL